MAASACIVPGTPNHFPTHPTHEAHGPEGLPGVAPRARASLAFLGLVSVALLGFATGAWLALAASERSPIARISAPAPQATLARARPSGLEPTFWRPPGSTAVRPDLRLRQRVYRPLPGLVAQVHLLHAPTPTRAPWRLAARGLP